MARELTFDPASFKGLEYAGWQKGAASYDDLFGSVTRHAMEPLLDATDVRAESSVLDVCCGLGYGAGAIAPLLFGAILDWHGANTPGAWGWAFVSLGVAGLGAVLSAVLLYRTTEAQVLHRGAGHRPAPLAVSPR